MESTIYKAVASVFVEDSGFDWLNALVSFVAVLIAAAIGYFSAKKAAEKGAKEAFEYSRQLEEDRVQRDGRASLALLYVELGKNTALFSGVLDSLKNLTANGKIKEFVFYVRHEDILNVTKLDESIGFSAILCLKCLHEYQDIAAQYNKTTFPDKEAMKMARIHAEGDIERIYGDYYRGYEQIKEYYKEHVVSKNADHPLAVQFDSDDG